MNLRNLFKKKVEPKPAPVAGDGTGVETREHRGDGARKAARRKFRHALQNKLVAELRNTFPGISPKMARFQARVKADAVIAYGTAEPDAHGRGLVR
jgi:hypothetical protein